jgi:hypothetical protein
MIGSACLPLARNSQASDENKTAVSAAYTRFRESR